MKYKNRILVDLNSPKLSSDFIENRFLYIKKYLVKYLISQMTKNMIKINQKSLQFFRYFVLIG